MTFHKRNKEYILVRDALMLAAHAKIKMILELEDTFIK
jgi:hypothetical protein